MQKWEYLRARYLYREGDKGTEVVLKVKDEEVTGKNVLTKINQLGSWGWEMFAVTPLIGAVPGTFTEKLFAMDPVYKTSTTGFHLWFTRPLAE